MVGDVKKSIADFPIKGFYKAVTQGKHHPLLDHLELRNLDSSSLRDCITAMQKLKRCNKNGAIQTLHTPLGSVPTEKAIKNARNKDGILNPSKPVGRMVSYYIVALVNFIDTLIGTGLMSSQGEEAVSQDGLKLQRDRRPGPLTYDYKMVLKRKHPIEINLNYKRKKEAGLFGITSQKLRETPAYSGSAAYFS